MQLFTARKASDPSVGHIVLAIRDSDGALLLADAEQGDLLEWVPAKSCLMGALYMDADQREWWRQLGKPPAHEHEEATD